MQTDQSIEDLLVIENSYIPAETGKRFLNYLVDFIFFYLILILAGVILAILNPSSVENIPADGNFFGAWDRLLSLILYAVYMGLMETFMKGKSMGKLITRTRAINLDGSKISAKTAFARGFSRAVPFSVFSAFGHPCNPWQDRWTNTMVIDEKKSEIN